MKILSNKKYDELLSLCNSSPGEFVKRVVNVDSYSSFVKDSELVEYSPSLEWEIFAKTSFIIPSNNTTQAKEDCDLFNAKMLFRLFEGIPAYQANDPIFWTSLVLLNDSFRHYTSARWGLNGNGGEKSTADSIKSRFFYEGTGSNTKRNSASRLWWYCSLAYSLSDEFKYVEFLIRNNDFAIGLIERNWASNRLYVRCLLVFAYVNRLNTSDMRSLFKELSAWLSIKVVPSMNEEDFINFLVGSKFTRQAIGNEEYLEAVRAFSHKNEIAPTYIELLNWDGEYIASSKDVAILRKSATLLEDGFKAFGYVFERSSLFSGDYCVKGDYGDVLSIDLN